MKHEGKQLIVRAYELARTGNFSSNKALRYQLKCEGYSFREIETEFKGRAFRDKVAELMGKVERPRSSRARKV